MFKDIARAINETSIDVSDKSKIVQSILNNTNDSKNAKTIVAYFGYYNMADIAKKQNITRQNVRAMIRKGLPDGYTIRHVKKKFYYLPE